MSSDAHIETACLTLRPVSPKDLDDLHRLWIDPDVRKYLWDDEIISRELVASIIDGSIALFAENGFGLWLASQRETNTLVGFCGFWYFHQPPELQLLFGVATEHWSKGLATEMAIAMMRFGFEELGFSRIIASADAPNAASLRVMEKAGMRFEKRIVINGRDTVYYEISRDESKQKVAVLAGHALDYR
jgi:ribosomal-protein-alanine N-acetyltransferase